MRFVRLAIISFVMLFLVIWGLSLFIPSHIRLSKAINVKASKDSVMLMLKDPANWRYWYPGLDSAKPMYTQGVLTGMIINNSDTSHPVYISKIKEDNEEVTAHFLGNNMNPVVNVWKTIEHPTSDSLTLQWYMDFDLRWYPWEKFSSIALEKSYAPKMEQGLSNLKKRVEN
ncbi:MAG: SRPBCC family protein [Chitinophagaceae bacterium]